jgi:hypothetical protein
MVKRTLQQKGQQIDLLAWREKGQLVRGDQEKRGNMLLNEVSNSPTKMNYQLRAVCLLLGSPPAALYAQPDAPSTKRLRCGPYKGDEVRLVCGQW